MKQIKKFLPTVVFITLFADCRVHYFTSTDCAIHSPFFFFLFKVEDNIERRDSWIKAHFASLLFGICTSRKFFPIAIFSGIAHKWKTNLLLDVGQNTQNTLVLVPPTHQLQRDWCPGKLGWIVFTLLVDNAREHKETHRASSCIHPWHSWSDMNRPQYPLED